MMREFGRKIAVVWVLVPLAGAVVSSPGMAASTEPVKTTKPAASASATPSASQILDRYLVAIGGREKLKSVRSMRMRGTMAASPGFTSPYLLEMKRPSSIRTEFGYQGGTAVEASDGVTGWVLVPTPGGKSVPATLTPAQLQELSQQADIDGPLVDWREKGNKIELVGKESAGSTMVWNLKLTDKAGIVRNFYLDAQTYLLVKQVVHRTVEGKETEAEMQLSDYREVAGLKFPYLFESRDKNRAGGQRLTIEKIEINPELGPERFRVPAPSVSVGAPKPGAAKH